MKSLLSKKLIEENRYYQQLMNRPANVLIQVLLFPVLIYVPLLLTRNSELNLLVDKDEANYIKQEVIKSTKEIENYLSDLCKANYPEQPRISIKKCCRYLEKSVIGEEERNRVFYFFKTWQNLLASRHKLSSYSLPKITKIINGLSQMTPKMVTYCMPLEFLRQIFDAYTISPQRGSPTVLFIPALLTAGSLPLHLGIICLNIFWQMCFTRLILSSPSVPVSHTSESFLLERKNHSRKAYTYQVSARYLTFFILACLLCYLWVNPTSEIATLACLVIISTVIKDGCQDLYYWWRSRDMESHLLSLQKQLNKITKKIKAINQNNWKLCRGSLPENTYFFLALNLEQKLHTAEILSEKLQDSFLKEGIPSYSDNRYILVSAAGRINKAVVKKIVNDCSDTLQYLAEQPGAPGL